MCSIIFQQKPNLVKELQSKPLFSVIFHLSLNECTIEKKATNEF